MISPASPSLDLSLAEFFRRYYQPAKLREATHGASMHYEHGIKSLAKSIGREPIVGDVLDEDTLNVFMAWTVETGLAPATANGRLSHLLTLARYAKRRKMTAAELPDIQRRREPQRIVDAWTLEEFERIIRAARKTKGVICGVPWPRWWESFLLVAFDTALRLGALQGLKLDDVDFQAKTLTLRAELSKNNHAQLFGLSDQTIEAICATLPPEREKLFPWPYAETAPLRKRYRRILKTAGLPHGPRHQFHKIRRTSSSLIARHGSIDQAIRQLGHRSPDVWRRYVATDVLGQHLGAAVLPRPAWDKPREIVVRQEIVEPEPPVKAAGPKIITLTRLAVQAAVAERGENPEHAHLLDELAAKEAFDANDLRRAIEFLGFRVKDFARVLDVTHSSVWAMVTGGRPITKRVTRRLRWALGLTWSRADAPPKSTRHAVEPLPVSPMVRTVLDADALTPAGLSIVASHIRGIDRQHVARRMRAAGIQSWRIAHNHKRPSPSLHDRLRWVFGLVSANGPVLLVSPDATVVEILAKPVLDQAGMNHLLAYCREYGMSERDVSRLMNLSCTAIEDWRYQGRKVNQEWRARWLVVFGIDQTKGGQP